MFAQSRAMAASASTALSTSAELPSQYQNGTTLANSAATESPSQMRGSTVAIPLPGPMMTQAAGDRGTRALRAPGPGLDSTPGGVPERSNGTVLKTVGP